MAQGVYIGASIGEASYEEDLGFDTFDESDTGYKFFAGYRFSDNFAVEGVYVDYGEPSGHILGIPAGVEITGYGVNLVGTIPLATGFEIFGKLGLLAWDGTATLGNLSGDESDTDLTYGIGAAYFFDDHFGVQAEWEFVNFDNSNMDADMLSVGVQYRF
jgi:OOP family OmpA-OmpF porin